MNAYDACSQIWLLGVGRSMVSSKLARGRLGLRSAAAIDHQQNEMWRSVQYILHLSSPVPIEWKPHILLIFPVRVLTCIAF